MPSRAPARRCAWIGTTLKTPYDQVRAWLTVVGRTRQLLAADVAGHSNQFRLPLTGRVDLSGAGLLVHSRSGFIAGPAVEAWRHSPTPITSILAYGPAYEVPDVNNHITAPTAGDVPYLGLVGDADNDVPFNANLWLSENIEQKRTAMASVATVPGLGHDAINQALSSIGTDDRLDCTPATCPSAAQHERFLTSVAQEYFAATMRARPSTLPLTANSTFPATLGGLPVRWAAVTNSSHRITLVDADSTTRLQVSPGSTIRRCRFYDPQDPTAYADACPQPNLGSIELVSYVHHVTLAPGGTLTIPTWLTGASSLNLQITPYGDRTKAASGSPLSVTVTTRQGGRVVLPLPSAAASVLANRSTAEVNGTYLLGTIRIPIPAALRSQTITSVELRAPHGGEYALRAVDALAAAPSATPAPGRTPATEASQPTAPSGGTPNADSAHAPSRTPHLAASGRVVGPLVQTDEVPTRSGS